MTVIEKPFGAYDLSTRALQAIRNVCGADYSHPALLIEDFQKDFDGTCTRFLQTPNCGRGTLDEILDAFRIVRPMSSGRRIRQYENVDELLKHIDHLEGLWSESSANRGTLELVIKLLADNKVTRDENGCYTVTHKARVELDQWKMAEVIEVTFHGPRTVILDMINLLPYEWPHLETVEDATMMIHQSDKVLIELGS